MNIYKVYLLPSRISWHIEVTMYQSILDYVDTPELVPGAHKAIQIQAGGPGSGRRKTVGYDPNRPVNKDMQRRDTEQVDRGYIKQQQQKSKSYEAGGPGSGRHAVGDKVRSHVWKPGTPNSYRE